MGGCFERKRQTLWRFWWKYFRLANSRSNHFGGTVNKSGGKKFNTSHIRCEYTNFYWQLALQFGLTWQINFNSNNFWHLKLLNCCRTADWVIFPTDRSVFLRGFLVINLWQRWRWQRRGKKARISGGSLFPLEQNRGREDTVCSGLESRAVLRKCHRWGQQETWSGFTNELISNQPGGWLVTGEEKQTHAGTSSSNRLSPPLCQTSHSVPPLLQSQHQY